MMQLLLVPICALAVAGLLAAEKSQLLGLKYVCKPIASLAFVTLAMVNATKSGPLSPLELGLVIGLVLGAAGDVCLMLPGGRWFLAGLCSFLLGHLAYAAGFFSEAPPRPALLWPAALGALAGAALLKVLWTYVRGKRVAVVAYTSAIIAMVIAAWGVWQAGNPRGAWLFLAAAAFAASDVAVVRERFVKQSFVNKAWGLPTYYAAQLLLASAIG
ncbi:MAG TPA: lysoplasmalogenase [Polyangiaceae bacterium]|nr:lysoplasmalogenase [Polyangiaceae bacterium]